MKSDDYITKCDADGIASLSKKLTEDLRSNIRHLGSFDIGSPNWMKMATSLGRIGSITEMEQKFPKDSEDATLWECEELALRYLLEDGKLNLCLRNLVEYKCYERGIRRDGGSFGADLREKMDMFEEGSGLMLNNAWKHVEALQTTDLPLLIQHIADVIRNVLEFPEDIRGVDIAKKQEIYVLHFLLRIARRIEDVGESRILPLLLEHSVFTNVAKFLQTNWQQLQESDFLVACEALSLIADCEDFSTHKDEFVASDEDRVALVALSAVLGDHVSDDLQLRRSMRPLLDAISAAKRRLGK